MVSDNYEKIVERILTEFGVDEQYNDGAANPEKVEAIGDLLFEDIRKIESLNGSGAAQRYSVDFVNSLKKYLQNKLDNTWIDSPKL